MTEREAIVEVLKARGIDPDQEVDTENGPNTAYNVMEAHIWAGFDEIEEGETP